MTGMILAVAVVRFLPHPPNFTPIAAIALFGGAYFDRRAWALAVPLAALFFGDIVYELLFGWGFHDQMPVVYATFVVIVGFGFLLRGKQRLWPVAGAGVAAALLFYLTTNFAVWASGSLYPRTAGGLAACYVAALPFFGSMLVGNLFYSALLFGAFTLAERRFSVLSLSRIAA
jgi:hypothetical protein